MSESAKGLKGLFARMHEELRQWRAAPAYDAGRDCGPSDPLAAGAELARAYYHCPHCEVGLFPLD